MAKGKRRGCALLHKWRVVDLLDTAGSLWWAKMACVRCGKTKDGLA